MAAGLAKNLVLGMKKIAEQNCKGKFLRNVADVIRKGLVSTSQILPRNTDSTMCLTRFAYRSSWEKYGVC